MTLPTASPTGPLTELTQALEEATQLAGGFCDVQVKLHGEERQGLRTQRHHQHLVISYIALLEPTQKGEEKAAFALKHSGLCPERR